MPNHSPRNSYERRVWRELLTEAQDWICGCGCGVAMRADVQPMHPDAPSVDHVVPANQNGPHGLRNMIAKRMHCNISRRDRPPTDHDLATLAAVQPRVAALLMLRGMSARINEARLRSRAQRVRLDAGIGCAT